MHTGLDELLEDFVDVSDCAPSELMLDDSLSYESEKNKYEKTLAEWQGFTKEQRDAHGKLETYLKSQSVSNLKSDHLAPARNYYLLRNEIKARLSSPIMADLLSIDNLHFEQALLELVENTENVDQIRELYKARKKTTGTTRNAGISTDEANRIKSCLRQGRELYLSGKSASLMVKPLNFFYSLTAYSYAVIILNNPLRYALENIPGSHGINYLPEKLRTQFGGSVTRGTFSDLFMSFPTNIIKDPKNKHFELVQDNIESLISYQKKRVVISAGTLLSMIPEIREYYNLVTGKAGRTHPIEIMMGTNPREIKLEFQIGDGMVRPQLDDVRLSFPGFVINERRGKYTIDVPYSDACKIRAPISIDMRGRFWYIENPIHPIVLPELCIHFLLTNALSSIMRYSPDRWGSMLHNETHSGISLIARKYLSAFENKFPMLMLRSISRYHPYID